ncbi:NADH-quinone oxidoreductase subunit NuoG [Rhodoligotrophos defluvii]|uniref:NADH-quinone oxidoreductase subunit NuoG n=1 Tax=Rhodoligotrophos defluvii TaxID=2561934 RepID=UPI0010C9E9FA|nr:NADH-quinone oxidoreductase subunit NuoG [Rhodoligotrophos defluvii]
MPKLIIDGKDIEVENGLTVLQACELAGVEIPRFCYHDRLTIAGNCRMCLIEVKGMPKPQASCALSVNDLRPGPNGEPPEIITRSNTVKKAREGVMEFLLINHPLDCPICDQGGECDLQDQAMAYGVDASRYAENKRAVEDKYLGPLVKTSMNRCIHCTRCVRFGAEVAGVPDLGAIGRGEDMEITTYLEHAMGSELQGNVIDLCPVGALTSKPYAFQARPWELRKTETVDAMDAVGSNIRVDCRGREVMRILPRLNEDINEEWISDKTRFIWDGLRTQRLDRPYVRENGKLRPANWAQAFNLIAERIGAARPERVAAIAGDLQAVEELYALKDLMTRLGVASVDCRQDGSRLAEVGGRAGYIFNATIAGIDQADAILLIGTNPRKEAAVLNARIRKAWRQRKARIAVVGEHGDLSYDHAYIGAGPDSLDGLARGEHGFLDVLRGAQHPLIILGAAATARPDGLAILGRAVKLAQDVGAIKDGWNGFSVLHDAAARVGGLDVGCVPAEAGKATPAILQAAEAGELDVLFLLGADEIDTSRLGNTFVIYQGTHGDRGAHRADVILPGATYTEKSGIFVNTEGRPQIAGRASFPPGDAREDWAILRALSDVLGHTLDYNTLDELRARIYEAVPHLAETDMVVPANPEGLAPLAALGGTLDKAPFVSRVQDFYLSNPIARASKVMAECSALRTGAERLVAAE